MTRVRLRATIGVASLLVLVPALLLRLLPRPQAQGLERLLPQMALLQSLTAAPSRPVPQLWQQRLGVALARQLWRQQRQVWWQGWGRHGSGGAYLVVALARQEQLREADRPAHSLQLDDLLVVASDPLALRSLQDQLRNPQRPLQGLDRRCLALLQDQQAVYWTPQGLAGLSGDLAPLLFGYQQGCLSLALAGSGLAFSGEATASPDPAGAALAMPELKPSPPLDDSLLLEVQAPALSGLLEGYLGRQLVRDSLAGVYGIGPGQLDRLRQLPVRMRLRAFPSGPFRAGLEVQLAVGAQRKPIAQLLQDLRPVLQRQGLEDSPPQWRAGGAQSAVLPSALWRRQDGVVVGGWRWRAAPGGSADLLVFLGPEPPPLARPEPIQPAGVQLRLRPAAMAAQGLLSPDWPTVVRQASQLEVAASPQQRGPLSRLTGRLLLAPPPGAPR